MHFFHLVHVKDIQGCWFVNMLFILVSSNHKAIALYLMLINEIFLNTLLSTGLLPSTLAHLF
jgi:hypothetical protein